jgi:hypothetical protein
MNIGLLLYQSRGNLGNYFRASCVNVGVRSFDDLNFINTAQKFTNYTRQNEYFANSLPAPARAPPARTPPARAPPAPARATPVRAPPARTPPTNRIMPSTQAVTLAPSYAPANDMSSYQSPDLSYRVVPASYISPALQDQPITTDSVNTIPAPASVNTPSTLQQSFVSPAPSSQSQYSVYSSISIQAIKIKLAKQKEIFNSKIQPLIDSGASDEDIINATRQYLVVPELEFTPDELKLVQSMQ